MLLGMAPTEPLLAKALANVERGEPWKARRRLADRVWQQPFDPRCAELLGTLELARGEVPAAGRLLWMARSDAPEHTEAIRLFVDEAKPGAVRRALKMLQDPVTGEHSLSASQVQDLAALGIDPAAERAPTRGEETRTWTGRARGYALDAAGTAGLLWLLYGAYRAVRYTLALWPS